MSWYEQEKIIKRAKESIVNEDVFTLDQIKLLQKMLDELALAIEDAGKSFDHRNIG